MKIMEEPQEPTTPTYVDLKNCASNIQMVKFCKEKLVVFVDNM